MVRSFQDRRVDAVIVMDSRVGGLAGAQATVEHLISLGRRRIGYIDDRNRMQLETNRAAEQRDALSAAGLDFDQSLVVQGGGGPHGGREAMRSIFALRKPPTAVFCYKGMTAMGALRTLHDLEIRVSADISVTGLDGLPLAAFIEPPLTTVSQPKSEMDRRAASIVLDLLESRHVESRITVPGELIVRESTTRKRSK